MRSAPERQDEREVVRPDRTDASELPGVTFTWGDGMPAAGLEFYGTNNSTLSGPRIWAGKPVWLGRLGPDGELFDWQRHGRELLCIRLSADALQTVRLDGTAGRRALTRPQVQGFRLSASRQDLWAEIEIQKRGFDRLHDWTIVSAFEFDRHLADHFTLTSTDPDAELVLAYARVRVTPSETSIVELPPGAYWIGLRACTFGFDFDGAEVVLDGQTFAFALQPVPLTQVMLPLDGKGRRMQPLSVRVVERSTDPRFAESEGEIALQYQVDGDMMLVAQSYASTGDAEYTTYALRIEWANKMITTTAFGPWARLLETVPAESR